MSSARVGLFVRLAAIVALGGLTAGCFQPMYAEHRDGSPDLREKLMGVELPPVTDKSNASRDARIGIEIRAHASLGIKKACAGDRPIVQHFVISVAHTGFICESFGFEPQPVEVRTDPAFAVPTELILRTVAAAFKLVEQNMGKSLIVHDRRRHFGRISHSRHLRLH